MAFFSVICTFSCKKKSIPPPRPFLSSDEKCSARLVFGIILFTYEKMRHTGRLDNTDTVDCCSRRVDVMFIEMLLLNECMIICGSRACKYFFLYCLTNGKMDFLKILETSFV